MKKIKKTGVYLAVFMLVFTSISRAKTFSDLHTSDWFYDDVSQLMSDDRAIIEGYPDGSFKPEASLQADQFITMVVRAAGYKLENGAGYWASPYIQKAYQLGLIQAEEIDEFQEDIRRDQMSLITARAMECLDSAPVYQDLEEVNHVVRDSHTFKYKYEEAIQKVYKAGVITGYPDGEFKADKVLNRAEASTVLARLINKDKRKVFDYEALYQASHQDDQAKFYGQKDWVDPATVSVRENAAINESLFSSEIEVSPTVREIELDFPVYSYEIAGLIVYEDEGPVGNQLSDFEKLLRRYIASEDADYIMDYVNNKKGSHSYLAHENALFYVMDKEYLVRINDDYAYRNNEVIAACYMQFNIYHRTEKYKEEMMWQTEDVTLYEGGAVVYEY